LRCTDLNFIILRCTARYTIYFKKWKNAIKTNPIGTIIEKPVAIDLIDFEYLLLSPTD
jgi:hypothetical protein